jgi:hypothetical protein
MYCAVGEYLVTTLSRVEHVFGQMTTTMNGLTTHVIGISRTKVKVVFKNLAYNMRRFVFLESRRLKESHA